MSSTVACIGFTDPQALAAIVRDAGSPVHDLSSTTQWSDDSGAMLLLDRTAQYARPGFATPVRTPYRGITPLENGLARVTLTDVSGFELDPFTVIPNNRYTVGWAPIGRVALVAMGVDTEFFATAEDFFDSPRSALPGFDGEPPEEVKQFGLAWPPTMEIETFLPSENADEALATLSGTVQFAEVRTNSRTGHDFLVSRLATVCGEIDLCTPLPLDGVPEPGSVAVGQVELLAGFPPFGVDDASSYEVPSERVGPRFRDGEPEGADMIDPAELPPADADLPDGLVLGEDGVVRTADEHSAWKSGDSEAGSRPAQGVTHETADAYSPEDDFDARRPLPERGADAQAPAGVEGVEGDAGATPTSASEAPDQDASAGPGEARAFEAPGTAPRSAPSDSGTSDAAPGADDDAPRPGETRREWRERTGR